jgi:uncharacterized protein
MLVFLFFFQSVTFNNSLFLTNSVKMKKIIKKSEIKDYEFVGKAIYFPSGEILAIGDLHLGYETMVKDSGTMIPLSDFEKTKKDLVDIFETLKKQKKKVSKLVFLGDMKHFFSYKKFEKTMLLDLFDSISDFISKEDIILIRGNHERMSSFAEKELFDCYSEGEVGFMHGDIDYFSSLDKGVKFVVMAHLHPAITLEDSQRVKREKFKCFLSGEFKSKRVIILPSFFSIHEGTSVNFNLSESACVIDSKKLADFEVYIVGEDNKAYYFGKLSSISRKEYNSF